VNHRWVFYGPVGCKILRAQESFDNLATMLLLRCFGCSVISFVSVDRYLVVNSSLSCIFRRHYGHRRRTSSRFKWPHQGFMPSTTPYQMFPAITTPDDAKGLVSYLTQKERLLLLSQLQNFREEEDFDGL